MDQNSVDQLLAQIQEQTADIQQQAAPAPAPGMDDPGAKSAIDDAAATVAEIAGDMTPPPAPRRPGELADADPLQAAVNAALPTPASAPGQEVHRLMTIEVPLIVQLGQRRMTVGEVMRLAVGAIVEFQKSADEELELLINNKSIGKGHAVKVGENFGIKITSIATIKDTIRSLGGQ